MKTAELVDLEPSQFEVALRVLDSEACFRHAENILRMLGAPTSLDVFKLELFETQQQALKKGKTKDQWLTSIVEARRHLLHSPSSDPLLFAQLALLTSEGTRKGVSDMLESLGR